MPLGLHVNGLPWQPIHDSNKKCVQPLSHILDLLPHATGTPDGQSLRPLVF